MRVRLIRTETEFFISCILYISKIKCTKHLHRDTTQGNYYYNYTQSFT